MNLKVGEERSLSKCGGILRIRIISMLPNIFSVSFKEQIILAKNVDCLLGQAMQAYSMPCCGSVGGFGARAVSRKTPIYFIYKYLCQYENLYINSNVTIFLFMSICTIQVE